MNKTEIRQIIDAENYKGYSKLVDLNGYIFFHEESFIAFKFQKLMVNGELQKIARVNYIKYKNPRHFITLMAYFCNFCLGNNIKFIHMYELDRANASRNLMASIGFYNRESQNKKIPAMKYIDNKIFEIYG